MTYSAKYRSSQIETQIANMAEFVVDIIAEQVQKEHIADDVHQPPMQEGVAYELP